MKKFCSDLFLVKNTFKYKYKINVVILKILFFDLFKFAILDDCIISISQKNQNIAFSG